MFWVARWARWASNTLFFWYMIYFHFYCNLIQPRWALVACLHCLFTRLFLFVTLTILSPRQATRARLVIFSTWPFLSPHLSILFSLFFCLNPLPQPPYNLNQPINHLYDLNQPRWATSAHLGSKSLFFFASLTISSSPDEHLSLVWLSFHLILSLNPFPLPPSPCYQSDELQALICSSFQLSPSLTSLNLIQPRWASSTRLGCSFFASTLHLNPPYDLNQPICSPDTSLLPYPVQTSYKHSSDHLFSTQPLSSPPLPFHASPHPLSQPPFCFLQVRYLSLYSKEIYLLRLCIL